MFSAILSIALVLLVGVICIGICSFLVRREFFLPSLLVRGTFPARQFLAGAWVLAVAGTVLLLLIGMIWAGMILVPRILNFISEGSTASSPVLFSPMGLWNRMGWLARAISIILFLESIWSLAVAIDRYLYFSAARKQSREFAPKVAGALKDSKLEEAIKIADRNKKSHLAEVVTAGLQEFRVSGGLASEESIGSSQRALERAEAMVHSKLKKGLNALATIGATAPFVGLFGTVIGILNAFDQISKNATSNIGTIASGISEALLTTCLGLVVAVAAFATFNYFTKQVKVFDEETEPSRREVIGLLRSLGFR